MSNRKSQIGVWGYARLVHSGAWEWTKRHWKATAWAASPFAVMTLVALIPYAFMMGSSKSMSEIGPSVVLPLMAVVLAPVVLYAIGLVWAPVEVHREKERELREARASTAQAAEELAMAVEARRGREEVAAFSRLMREQIRKGSEVVSDLNLFEGKFAAQPMREKLHLDVVDWTKGTELELWKLREDWCERFRQQGSLDRLQKQVPELSKFMKRRLQCLEDFEEEVKAGS